MKKFNKVLLIDDDPVATFFNKCLLSRSGITTIIDVVTNEQEGLDWICSNCQLDLLDGGKNAHVLVFSDLSMTAMNKYSLLDAVLELKQRNLIEVPNLYLMTSKDELDEGAPYNKYPVRGYLTQPLTEEDIKLLKFKEGSALNTR